MTTTEERQSRTYYGRLRSLEFVTVPGTPTEEPPTPPAAEHAGERLRDEILSEIERAWNAGLLTADEATARLNEVQNALAPQRPPVAEVMTFPLHQVVLELDWARPGGPAYDRLVVTLPDLRRYLATLLSAEMHGQGRWLFAGECADGSRIVVYRDARVGVVRIELHPAPRPRDPWACAIGNIDDCSRHRAAEGMTGDQYRSLFARARQAAADATAPTPAAEIGTPSPRPRPFLRSAMRRVIDDAGKA